MKTAVHVAVLACAILASPSVIGQQQPGPAVEWKTLGWLDSKPPYGTINTLHQHAHGD
jgi:hypothetical protein